MNRKPAQTIQAYNVLTPEQQNTLSALLKKGAFNDGYYYDAELENPELQLPFPAFYLIYHKETLAGFLSFSVFPKDETHHEVYTYAFIHPNFRRKGFFTQLLYTASLSIKNAPIPRISLYFPVSHHTPRWIQEKLHSSSAYTYDYSEYIMKKQLSFTNFSHSKLSLEWEEYEAGANANSDFEYSLWLEDLYAGGCLIAPITTEEAMIYEFAIETKLRGQGYGTLGLQLICQDLYQQNYRTVSLQVSSKNKIAHSLYLNCGFQITEELKFFRYINPANKSSDNS